MGNFLQRDVVGHGSETQLQVGENIKINIREKRVNTFQMDYASYIQQTRDVEPMLF